MPLIEIEQILGKHKDEEERIEKLLNECGISIEHKASTPAKAKSELIKPEEAILRNKQLLKDLENVKSNLRSKAIFSPSEMQWENVVKNYKECPSLPVVTYKCHLPIFV